MLEISALKIAVINCIQRLIPLIIKYYIIQFYISKLINVFILYYRKPKDIP